MLPGRKATLLGLVLQLTVIVVKYSSVSVYSSSTSFFLVFTKIFLCSLTNNVISRVACLVGRLLCSDLLPLPAPMDCRCREIFIHFAAVFLPYSHIYLCKAVMQKCWSGGSAESTVPPFCSYKKTVHSNQQRYFARCLVGRLLCSDLLSLPSPNWLSLSWNIHPFRCRFSALQSHLSVHSCHFNNSPDTKLDWRPEGETCPKRETERRQKKR